jgi:hypothetical protein
VATYLGLFTSIYAFAYGVWIIFKTLVYGDIVRGYPTIMITILFLGGVQLFFIGVVGEYIGRIFNKTKARPLYFVQGYKPSRAAREKTNP